MQSGLFVVEQPVSFFRAYYYAPIDANVSEGSGTARFEASRVYTPMIVDELIPNDPWPESYVLTVR